MISLQPWNHSMRSTFQEFRRGHQCPHRAQDSEHREPQERGKEVSHPAVIVGLKRAVCAGCVVTGAVYPLSDLTVGAVKKEGPERAETGIHHDVPIWPPEIVCLVHIPQPLLQKGHHREQPRDAQDAPCCLQDDEASVRHRVHLCLEATQSIELRRDRFGIGSLDLRNTYLLLSVLYQHVGYRQQDGTGNSSESERFLVIRDVYQSSTPHA